MSESLVEHLWSTCGEAELWVQRRSLVLSQSGDKQLECQKTGDSTRCTTCRYDFERRLRTNAASTSGSAAALSPPGVGHARVDTVRVHTIGYDPSPADVKLQDALVVLLTSTN